ncbi:hypothetical protein ACFQ5D_15700 [Paenibacillus farraposensis]|uniref:Uncharacterized protein n=1 Tax=Paenibacillus farraposensis TaxID=2807095 RepID=A0ABW4DFQ4_9BACL|nr:hypothetical protein [Paenibacillus farraposensis]
MFGILEAGGKISRTKHAEDFAIDRVNHEYTFKELAGLTKKHCVAI